MDLKNVTVALPTKDLRQAFLFYRDGLGLNHAAFVAGAGCVVLGVLIAATLLRDLQPGSQELLARAPDNIPPTSNLQKHNERRSR